MVNKRPRGLTAIAEFSFLDVIPIDNLSAPTSTEVGKITLGEIVDNIAGDVGVTSGGVSTIGASKVTNAMLTGSIDPAKITGVATVKTDNLSVFAATTSLQLRGVISDETGTGALVFGTSPTIVTPTIASFTNATHSHLNAAGGGTITEASISDLQSYLLNVVEDTTPQLGGALDGQGNDLNNMGVLFLTEQADAEADVAGKGQFWVDTRTPNMAFFTDDAGTDFGLSGYVTINFVIDGGGSAITTGKKGVLVVDFPCTVDEWAIIGEPDGAIVVDVNRSTFAGYPTTSSIAGTELPTITATNDTGEDRTLTSWSTISAGDIIEFEVDSVATIQRVTIALKVRRT